MGAGRVLSGPSDGNGIPAASSSLFLRGRASKLIQGGGCVCSIAGGLVSTIRDYACFGQMLLNDGEFNGVRFLQPVTVGLLAQDWLNEFSVEKRRKPLWVWDTPGIGFSPLGQIGVDHPSACSRHAPGSQLHTVHWGGAGGSGYMLNWPHKLLVLTYTGVLKDTDTQKAMWRATFGALRRGGAKPCKQQAQASGTHMPDCAIQNRKRPREDRNVSEDACFTTPRKTSNIASVPRSTEKGSAMKRVRLSPRLCIQKS